MIQTPARHTPKNEVPPSPTQGPRPSMNPAPIRLKTPVIVPTKNEKRELLYLVDIKALEWTLHVPEAHEIVERALYRGFFDIIDRTRLTVLRQETESRWNARIQTNYATARQRIAKKEKR